MNKQDARFWFSWLKDRPAPSTSAGEQALQHALDEVIRLLCNNTESLETILPFLPSSKAYALPEALEPLIDHLEKMHGKELSECYVCGTLDPVSAKSVSIQQLGIDIFSLPAKWPSDESESCFRYVCVSSLASVLKEIQYNLKQRSIDERNRDRIRLQLKAARCNTWLERSRSRVAHGNRDIIQFENSEKVQSALQSAIDDFPASGHRVCQNGCSAVAALTAGITRLSGVSSDAIKHSVTRDLANLDCMTPKLASLLNAGSLPVHAPVFDQIVVFEDNPDMRKHIVDSLTTLFTSRCRIIEADPIQSRETRTLVALDGRPIGGFAKNCHELDQTPRKQLRTLLCFDLEVSDPAKPDKFLNIYGISTGLWFLYKCAKDYPLASRLVITGHRRLDEQGLNAGAGDLLFKPFAGSELATAVRSAGNHRILWVSPESVREEWRSSFRHFKLHTILADADPLDLLGAWLSVYNLELDIVDGVPDVDSPGTYDLAVLDLYCFKPGNEDYDPNRILECIAAVNQWPRRPKLIVLVPHEQAAMRSDGILRALGGILVDGTDRILHKPIALTGDKHSSSIGQEIIGTLSESPHFDVKYVAIAPLMGLVWARTRERFCEALSDAPKTEHLKYAWAPLAVLLGERFGFSERASNLYNAINSNKRIEDSLAERLRKEITNNPKRWSPLCEKEEIAIIDFSNGVLAAFKKSIENSDVFAGFWSIEQWLMDVIEKPEDSAKRSSFEDYLVNLFGGETRLSIGAKGGWFNEENQFVTDSPLIIEFCAKRGIIARSAIEGIVVEFLTQEGCEAMVLIQEIPIRGYMLPR